MDSTHTKVFTLAVERLLDVACFSYYVKADNIISDHAFDELEKFYCKLTGEKTYRMRGVELEEKYTTSTKDIYSSLSMQKKEKIEDPSKRKLLKKTIQKRFF